MRYYYLVVLISIFVACKTPDIVISQSLKNNATIMNARGRQGWQFNQVVHFGDYHTSKIKRGWTTGYNFPFFIHFQAAQQKLHFIQYNNSSHQEATVLCVSKFLSDDISLLNSFFSYSFNYENTFAGTIINDTDHWDFIIHNPDESLQQDANAGYLKDANGNTITIRAVKKIERQLNLVAIDIYGFEFFLHQQSIGAISILNNGRVWILHSLPANEKLVIASISSALLVRQNLEAASSSSINSIQ